MTHNIPERLHDLEKSIAFRLDRIHEDALRKFRGLTRSVGQRTRQDRKAKK